MKFIDHDKPLWQRTLAIEVLHVLTAKPKLLKSVSHYEKWMAVEDSLLGHFVSTMTCSYTRQKSSVILLMRWAASYMPA